MTFFVQWIQWTQTWKPTIWGIRIVDIFFAIFRGNTSVVQVYKRHAPFCTGMSLVLTTCKLILRGLHSSASNITNIGIQLQAAYLGGFDPHIIGKPSDDMQFPIWGFPMTTHIYSSNFNPSIYILHSQVLINLASSQVPMPNMSFFAGSVFRGSWPQFGCFADRP